MKSKDWMVIPEFPDYKINTSGDVWSVKSKKILNKPTTQKGYVRYTLYKNKKPFSKSAHSLVLSVFVGNRPAGMQIAHLDGNPENNSLENLVYCTASENEAHKENHGTKAKHENHGSAKLCLKDVAHIRRTYKCRDKNYGSAALAKKYGVTRASINSVVRGETWRQ